ncbi:MAG: SUMF1/EgtB/PvdO family nonheme iron enzyme [Planctomycetota bacterium]
MRKTLGLEITSVAGRDDLWTPRLHVGAREAIVGCQFSIPEFLRRRCLQLQREPGLLQLPGFHQEAGPSVVCHNPRTAKPADMGLWLGQCALRGPITQEIAAYLRNGSELCLSLHAPPEVSSLPWECLTIQVGHEPVELFLSERAILVRALGDARTVQEPGTDPLHVLPRALLLVGSVWQLPSTRTARHDVVATHRAIVGAGFSCVVACGADVDPVVQPRLPLRRAVDLIEHLRDHRYSVVHYIGHSTSVDAERDLPTGAEGLTITGTHGDDDVLRIAADQDDARALGNALARAGVRVVVLHACASREAMMRALLSAPTVQAVVGMGAYVDPDLTTTWSKSFYANFKEPGADLWEACREARRALELNEGGRWREQQWVPLLGQRAPIRIVRADPQACAIAQYRERIAKQHAQQEGLFRQEFGNVLATVYVRLSVKETREPTPDGLSGGTKRRELASLDALRGRALSFAQLLDGKHRRWVLSGEPGSGKTTTLRMHAFELAQDDDAELPIYLRLAEWITDPFMRGQKGMGPRSWIGGYLERETEIDGLAEALHARRHQIVLLLDGYDELSEDDRMHLRDTLLPNLGTWGHGRIVIASRPQAATSLPHDFGNVDIHPLQPAQARALLRDLLLRHCDTAEDPARVELLADRWQQRFAGPQRTWRDLGSTPVFVSLLALQLVGGDVDEFGDLKNPRARRHEFFDRAFDVLARGLHRAKPQPIADVEALKQVLAWLAFRMTTELKVFASVRELHGWLTEERRPQRVRDALARGSDWSDAKSFLKVVRERTMILGGTFTGIREPQKFWHRHFQEALCAFELEQQGAADFLATGKDLDAADAEAQRLRSLWPDWLRRKQADQGGINATSIARERQKITAEIEDLTGDPTTRWERIRSLWSELADDEDFPRHGFAELRPRVEAREFAGLVEAVARSRARRQDQAFWAETLALLAGRAGRPHGVIAGLLERDRAVARRAIATLDSIDPETILAAWRAFDVRRRVELLDRVPSQCIDVNAAAIANVLRDLVAAEGPAVSWDDLGQAEWVLAETAKLLAHPTTELDQESPEAALSSITSARTALVARCPPPEGGSRAFREHLPPRVRFPWCHVAPDEFVMGSPAPNPDLLSGREPGRYADEVPRRVRISQPFWIAAVPITYGQYRLFAQNHEQWLGEAGHNFMPAVRLSWFSARLFCEWAKVHLAGEWQEELSRHSERHQLGWSVPDELEVRLPSEAEWEITARAGRARDLAYWTGPSERDLAKVAWFRDNSGGHPHPVASSPIGPNPLGLFDVHGNVFEWCRDRYGPYAADHEVITDPTGPSQGNLRVVRGGSYKSVAESCRSSHRNACSPDDRNTSTGFRVVLS